MTGAELTRDQRDAVDKLFNTTKAEAARAGWEFYVASDNATAVYIVGRWNRCRSFPSLDEARKFLATVTGARAG